MTEYKVEGSCTQCGDCCTVKMVPSLFTKSRKNLITINRNGAEETMLYCDFLYLKDGDFLCKLFEEYEKVAVLDLIKPLDVSVVTEAMRNNIVSVIDGTPMTEQQAVMCCHTADFPHGCDLERLAKTNANDPSVDNLHYLVPNCTYEIKKVAE